MTIKWRNKNSDKKTGSKSSFTKNDQRKTDEKKSSKSTKKATEKTTKDFNDRKPSIKNSENKFKKEKTPTKTYKYRSSGRNEPMLETVNVPNNKANLQPERIAKVIANLGYCSRRQAEALIEEGLVYCNNEKVTHPSLKVTLSDIIKVEGKILTKKHESGMWILHKPKGYVTTTSDPENRPTVFDLLPKHLPRLLSVGRLDINSEGLLLLTNDSNIATFLERPENKIKRTYKVRVFGEFNKDYILKLKKGIKVEDIHYKPINAEIISQTKNNAWLKLELFEGKNREIRKIMEHLGLKVAKLIRIEYGNFALGELKTGKIVKVSNLVTQNLLDQIDENNSRKTQSEETPSKRKRS
ncbi:MAG: rRNA pseudouridine synthase [Sphingobacteriia bacterium]|nr:rRNA pseudouridine synthase [Sphingobacteriia bacterium]